MEDKYFSLPHRRPTISLFSLKLIYLAVINTLQRSEPQLTHPYRLVEPDEIPLRQEVMSFTGSVGAMNINSNVPLLRKSIRLIPESMVYGKPVFRDTIAKHGK